MVLTDTSNTERFHYTNHGYVAEYNSYSIPTALPRVELGGENCEKVTTVTGEVDSSATKEYDPHDYPTSKEPTTYCESMLHYLKASIGTGILAIPSAFRESGYAVGIVGVLFVSIFYTACIHLLISAEYELCKRRKIPNLSYGATVNAAFTDGPRRLRRLAGSVEWITNFLLLVYECGGCAVYIIFIANNLKHVIDFYLQTDVDLRTLMTYITLPIVLLCWVRNLKILVPLSAVAHVITVVCFVLVFWYVFRESPAVENRQAVRYAAGLPRYLSTVIFTVACSGIVLPLKSEMRKPKQFSTKFGVFNMSMVPITLLCALFGFFGYVRYGNEVEDSITLNLPKHELLAQGILGLYSVSIYISYFLCYYVVFDILWNDYMSAKIHDYKIVWEYVVRTLIPLFTFFLAYAIPDLGVFISLVGAIGIISTSLVIPIVVHTLVFWNTFKSSSSFVLFAARNVILLVASMSIFVISVADSVKSVIHLWSS